MPWNNDQVAEYGESFRAWTNEQFTLACNLVKDAAAFNTLSIVVLLCFSSPFSLGVSFIWSRRVCSQNPSWELRSSVRFLYVQAWYFLFDMLTAFCPAIGNMSCHAQGIYSSHSQVLHFMVPILLGDPVAPSHINHGRMWCMLIRSNECDIGIRQEEGFPLIPTRNLQRPMGSSWQRLLSKVSYVLLYLL